MSSDSFHFVSTLILDPQSGILDEIGQLLMEWVCEQGKGHYVFLDCQNCAVFPPQSETEALEE